MSKIQEVLKNKNRVEKLRTARRKEELARIKTDSLFKARLFENVKELEMLLDSIDVGGIVVEVPDNSLGKFGAAIYSTELADYDIRQVDGIYNQFIIRKKFIEF